MRKLAALFGLALLLQLAAADVPFSVSYQSQFTVPQGQAYSFGNFTYLGQQAYIALSPTQIYSVFLPAPTSGDYYVLTAPQKIADVLSAYYYSIGNSPQAAGKMDSVHAAILATAQTRKKGEASCRTLLGTDRHSCTDFFSCQQACYSVTSFCEPVALGTGRVFINAIWSFENDSRDLDAAYASEGRAYSGWKNASTAGAMWDYLYSISEINRAATRAAQSPLYDWYSFCFRPDYSLSNITAIQVEAQNDYLRSFRFFTINDDSAAASQYALAGTEKRIEEELWFNQSMQVRLSAGRPAVQNNSNNSTAIPAVQIVQGPQNSMSAALVLMIALLAALLIISVYAYYYMRKKEKRK